METSTELNNIKFTFYGDLLGVSNLYAISLSLAKQKLDEFYNLVFDKFKNMAEKKTVEIFLFSDSLFITGKELEETIKLLGEMYEELFYMNTFFRGVIVNDKLDYDPRIESKNWKKCLPTTDVLFRAISLEKSVSGMRLLIEKELAQKILPLEWLTEDLYKKHVNLAGYDKYDFRRKIILNSEWNAYEYLWSCFLNPSDYFKGGIVKLAKRILSSPRKLIQERLLQVPKVVRVHLKETEELFERSAYRYKITDEVLKLSND